MPLYRVDLAALPKLTNPVYYPLYKNQNRYLVLYGGAGSGKSVFAAQKTIRRMLEEPGHKILVVRKVAKTLRQSTFALLCQIISDWNLGEIFEINKTEMEIRCINGSQVIHAGLDDVEKIKSIQGITSIWIEESSELEKADFMQLDLRLRGKLKYYKQITLSFNPISVSHWLKTEFFDNPKEDAFTLKTTYKDNKFLDDEYIKVLMALKDTDEYYFTVYVLGNWGVLGKTIFNAMKVNSRISEIEDIKVKRIGYFLYKYENERIVDESIKFIDDPSGYITIYQDAEFGHPYVIGGDTAGEGSDYFAGQVIDNSSGLQVAVLHNRFDEDLYTKQMYCLGKYYNSALISIEANFSTYPVLELQRLGYNKQYKREIMDTYTNRYQERFGWRTDKLTRPIMISNLVQIVREKTECFNDKDTLDEMLTFVRNENGRAEAQAGKHDDLIMALAIVYKTRGQQDYNVKFHKEEKTLIQKDKQKRARRSLFGGRRLA